MASIGHVILGCAAGRVFAHGAGLQGQSLKCMALFAALAMLPDADVIGFPLGVPYGAPFGHRGATHSLLAAAAAGVLAGVLARVAGWPALATAVAVTAVVASHGLLDALTDGGLGVALAWPWSRERYFAPWRPIPVSPIGMDFLSARGLEVSLAEAKWFAPFLAIAVWPPGFVPDLLPAGWLLRWL